MKVFKSLLELDKIKNTAIALGNFDGVHKGHQALITACVQDAVVKGLVPSVFTFSNHPANVLAGKTVVKNILSFEEKSDLLSKLGVKYLFNFEFDKNIRTISPDYFCRNLLTGALKAKEVFCGTSYRFGYKAEGNPDILKEKGIELGYNVSILPQVKEAGIIISSTLIRQALAKGDMELYELYTGRLYTINGHVIEGRRMGKSMGFPTINLSLDQSMVIPKSGVYVTQTFVDGKFYDSITNVGNKPTVGIFEKNAETHIFDFNRDIYGYDVKIEFLKILRPEVLFESVPQLTEQIKSDCIKAKDYHKLSRRIKK